MRNLLLFILPTVLLLSCGSNKKITESTSSVAVEEVKTEVMYVGVVEIDEECGAIIKVENNGITQTFAPSNFDERYKKSGMRVRFGTEDVLVNAKKCATHLIVIVTRMTPLR